MSRLKYQEAAALEVKGGLPPATPRQLILEKGTNLNELYNIAKGGP